MRPFTDDFGVEIHRVDLHLLTLSKLKSNNPNRHRPSRTRVKIIGRKHRAAGCLSAAVHGFVPLPNIFSHSDFRSSGSLFGAGTKR